MGPFHNFRSKKNWWQPSKSNYSFFFSVHKSGGKKTILDKEEVNEEEERKIRILTTFPIAIFSVTNKRDRG